MQTVARFLFILGISLWFGGIVFLGYGVAPVNFQTAEQWELQGENPHLPDQPVNYRTIGGELTAEAINRLNHLELAGFVLAVMGLAISWYPRWNINANLITRTILLVIMGILLFYYSEVIGGRLNEIRTTIPLDFTDIDGAQIPPEQQEFDRLHNRYTQLSSVTALLCIAQLALASWMPGNSKTS